MTLSPRRKIPGLVAAGVLGLSLVGTGPALGIVGASPSSPSAAVEAAAPAPRTQDPARYVAAAFRAWRTGDLAALDRYVPGAVLDFLAARAPEAGRWSRPTCEGAAGSTYCTWSRSETRLTLRVANEPASQGEPDAVTSASFTPPAGGVAIWPFVTAEAAANAQEQVDQGHSPWLLEPSAVAGFYAGAVLGWDDAGVEPVRPGVYWLTDPATGARAEVELAQPARTGDGGIWAVVDARSVALG
ncbi:MAG TPA: hypothetical protein VIL48_10955 [Acidimicrobiales bacterium]